MYGYRFRIFTSASTWIDTVVYADTTYNATKLAEGQSPVGRAIYLSEA